MGSFPPPFFHLYRDHAEVKGGERKGKTTLTYSPLKTALKPYSWSSLSRIQTKDLNPAIVFTILGLFSSDDVYVSRYS